MIADRVKITKKGAQWQIQIGSNLFRRTALDDKIFTLVLNVQMHFIYFLCIKGQNHTLTCNHEIVSINYFPYTALRHLLIGDHKTREREAVFCGNYNPQFHMAKKPLKRSSNISLCCTGFNIMTATVHIKIH